MDAEIISKLLRLREIHGYDDNDADSDVTLVSDDEHVKIYSKLINNVTLACAVEEI